MDNFYLFDDTNNEKKPIKILTNMEASSYELANTVMFEFQYYKRRFKEIYLNLEEFETTLLKYSNQIEKMHQPKIENDLMNLIYIDVNRTFINFITSLKVFIEHIEKRLNRKYGDTSEQFKLFKQLTSNLYENYFAYRFLYYLRDYSIHDSYPINNFDKDTELVHDTSQYKSKLHIQFNRDNLLENKRMRKKMGGELSRYNNLFPVKNVLDGIHEPLRKLFDGFVKIEKNYFVKQANIISNVFEENANCKIMSYGKLVEVKGCKYNIETIILPIEFAKQILQNLKPN
jgi:hypothetical protein